MKAVYVTVKVMVADDADVDDFASETDYEFKYNGEALTTEIVDVQTK